MHYNSIKIYCGLMSCQVSCATHGQLMFSRNGSVGISDYIYKYHAWIKQRVHLDSKQKLLKTTLL